MSSISGKTTVCGLIGDPVEFTMSPAMHNAAFEHTGLEYIYLPFRVKKERLYDAIKGMRAFNIRGLNVTLPHKLSVMALLNEIDKTAERIGAVNTIVNDNGRLKGFNTDGAGFLKSLQEEGIEPGGRNVAVIGAGGVSRAASVALLENGAKLTIIDRQPGIDTAVKMAADINAVFGQQVNVLQINDAGASEVIKNADILVNATRVGMFPNVNETPVEAGWLGPGQVVFDVNYNPMETRLLREARLAGAKTISGLGMLAWQGAAAFEYWTGIPAPVEVMKEAARKALNKNSSES
jgi:shikimate dehydrogenase